MAKPLEEATSPEQGEGPALALPAGTVTFLLTDIEGSTRLWETAPEGMPSAVARHYEIVDEAIARHGGVRPLEQGEGDSTVTAFARAADGLAAALAAQRALLAEPWPDGVELRVRMALHTGDARLRDSGNYFGVAVNRCARLRAIGHGGQILVSRATCDLAQDGLPEGVELVDSGVHRLRDLGRPEHVFVVSHEDLPAIGDSLRSLDSLPNNLPTEPSSFVGREDELVQLAGALASTRALTLTGAGGCGKTRLAMQAAADVLERFPGGAWWVALAPIADPELIGDALAAAIGVRPLPGQTSTEAAIFHLSSKQALIVLDNCEHMLDACADLTNALLQGCPELTVLTTSREPLGLPGETSWRVPSLSLPRDDVREAVGSLAQSDAVRLFVERACQVRPNFNVTNENAPAVAQICHDLDGIPLAIELAAARVRMLSVEQIEQGLADRFRLLTGGARTAVPRQQTLRASVDWSHELLEEPERKLLRRLGVFAGSFSLDACEEVCSGEDLDRYSVLDLLTSLVDKSLVVVEEHESESRYRLLATVRHYALDRLLEAGESAPLRDRHRDAFVTVAERIQAGLVTDDQPRALGQADVDSANLHAAIEWAMETEPEVALRICFALAFWWRLRAPSAGNAALEQALEAASGEPSPLRARGLWARAYLAASDAEVEIAKQTAEAALAMGEELEDEWIQGRALHALAFPALWADPRAAIEICGRARELARAAGDDFVVADASQLLGFAHWMQDDYESARREEALAFEIGQRLGNRDVLAFHWVAEALTPWGAADFDRRRAQLEECLAVSAEIDDPTSNGFGEAYLAFVDIYTGNPASALERLEPARQRLVAAGAGLALATVDYFTALARAALGGLDEARETLADVVARGADGLSFVYAWSLIDLAGIERLQGDVDGAESHARQALGVADHIGAPTCTALAQQELARQAMTQDEWGEAEKLLQDALPVFQERGQAMYMPGVLAALAEAAAGLESHEEAARLMAAADRARRQLGVASWLPEGDHWRALEGELRSALGDSAYETAIAEGEAMTIEEAVAYVRRARGSRKRPAGGWESLTPTEREVVRHAAEGLTNPEIGARMFISRGTVKVHLSHIYAKLDIRNRAELTAEA
ncbi:MAG: LuxR C-terminal-related transcriptional regulator, partial [Actinobacteria bacterium]|nr:LuxR C-terminal-related transcriptional regulator [Actinomycetota bacterium]